MVHTDESQVSLRCVANVTFCHCCFLLCFGLEGKIVSNIALCHHTARNPLTHINTHANFISVTVFALVWSFTSSALSSLSFRVLWPPAQANQVGMSTTHWCCTTTTAPAGPSRLNCPSRLTCFEDRTSALSFGIALVSMIVNKIVRFYLQDAWVFLAVNKPDFIPLITLGNILNAI